MSLLNKYQMVMKNSIISCAWVVVSFSGMSAMAGAPGSPVPNTFANGMPADAEKINANYSELVSQIAQLQAQLTALQPQVPTLAILGTYDFVNVGGLIDQSPDPHVAHSSGRGYFSFAPGGIVTGSNSWSGGNLNMHNQVNNYSNSQAGVNFGPYSYITMSVTPDSGTESLAGSYTITGSTINISLSGSGPIAGTISPDGKIIVLATHGDDGIVIGIKR